MRRVALWVAIALIVLGVLGVLNALGVIAVSIWGLFWALLLIALGAWMVLGVIEGRPAVETEEAKVPLEGAEWGRIRIRHGAGRLWVRAGAAEHELLSGTFRGGVNYETKREGDGLAVEMRLPSGSVSGLVYPWRWGGGRGLEWDVALNADVPLSLDVEGGASENRLELRDLRVTELKMETGASASRVSLPASAAHTKADISCGVGSVEVRVPADVAARIRVTTTLGGTSVDRRRFPRVGSGLYESPDYETAANRVDLDIDASLGSVAVR